MTTFQNRAAPGIAITRLITSAPLLRPANGTRPLLVGFMVSSIFAMYVAVIRVFSLQATSRPFFGYLFLIWLLFKLWSIWGAALHTNRPFLKIGRHTWRSIFGHHP